MGRSVTIVTLARFPSLATALSSDRVGNAKDACLNRISFACFIGNAALPGVLSVFCARQIEASMTGVRKNALRLMSLIFRTVEARVR